MDSAPIPSPFPVLASEDGEGNTEYHGGFRADFVGSKTSLQGRSPLPAEREGGWGIGKSYSHPFSQKTYPCEPEPEDMQFSRGLPAALPPEDPSTR